MERSIKEEIQILQLSIFQDFFELQMTARYGPNWIDEVIKYCENYVNSYNKNLKDYEDKLKSYENEIKAYKDETNDKKSTEKSSIKYSKKPKEPIKPKQSAKFFSYETIVNNKKSKGKIMIDKRCFDITLLYALIMKPKFFSVCKPENSEDEIFSNYITNIKDDRNTLHGHVPNLDDIIHLNALQAVSIQNARDFIEYLDRLGWSSGNDNRKNFISKYKKIINALGAKMSGFTTEAEKLVETSKGAAEKSENEKIVTLPPKVHILISVQNQKGESVSGYQLEIRNRSNETVASWISSKEDFQIYIDSGQYRIEEIKVPQGYKTGSAYSFEVSRDNENNRYVKTVERALSNDALYVKAFGYLVDSEEYPTAVSLLTELEQENHLESIMLLSFLYKQGIGVRKDSEKSSELLDFASFQMDESSWLSCAEQLIEERNYIKATPYCLAYSQKYESGDGFYKAGIIFLKKIKNYEFCKLCFKLALDKGNMKAKQAYDYICGLVDKIGKEEFIKKMNAELN